MGKNPLLDLLVQRPYTTRLFFRKTIGR